MKIQAVKIVIGQREGKSGGPIVVENLPEDELYKKIDREFSYLSRHAPEKGNGYNKTNYTVFFADGNTYEGRMDLNCDVHVDLRSEMKKTLEFYTFKKKPYWMEDDRYEAIKRSVPKLMIENTIKFLEKYNI